MPTEPMHGPVALAIFWIWLDFIAVGALAYLVYRLFRPRLKKASRPAPLPPPKYADRLRQRIRKKPSRPGTTPRAKAGASPKPPPTPK